MSQISFQDPTTISYNFETLQYAQNFHNILPLTLSYGILVALISITVFWYHRLHILISKRFCAFTGSYFGLLNPKGSPHIYFASFVQTFPNFSRFSWLVVFVRDFALQVPRSLALEGDASLEARPITS